MATKFLTNIDLNQNQIVNATFEVLGTAPNTGLFEGRMYYNSTTDSLEVYSGSAWRKFVNSIAKGGSHTDAITIGESNGTVTLTLNLADTDSAGLLSADFWNALTDATDAATASKLVKRDGNGNIKVATPTDAAHAATKGYVDAARQGLDVKQSVRAATTGPVLIASALEEGDTLDTTVTLVAGDRVLVKNQSTASENGIYVVQESGAAVRAADANGTADTGTVSGGTFTFVEEGTVNADSGWVVSSNGPITVGTDPIAWVQFSGTGQITAGTALSKDGNTLNVTVDDSTIRVDGSDNLAVKSGTQYTTLVSGGAGTSATWGALSLNQGAAVTGKLPIGNGGTNADTAADARGTLAATPLSGQTTSTAVLARVVHQACAASSVGVSTTTVTHNFNTKNVTVQVYQVSSGETVNCDVLRSTLDAVIVTMNGTISADDFHIVVTG
jgi:hypothetical protein